MVTKVTSAEGRRKQADKGNALPDGSFPIPDKEHLMKAIRLLGHAKDKPKARRHIKKRARELGVSIDLAKSHSSKIHPSLDRKPGVSNWVDQEGDLPSYIDRIAKHIHSDSGLSRSHAIAAAVNRVKELAAKGNAQAIRAVAQWERKKASARARPNKSGKGRASVSLAKSDDEKRKKSVRSLTRKNETDEDRRNESKVKVASARAGASGVRSTVAGRHVRTRNRQAARVGGGVRPWDENKIVRDQGGRFGEKIDAAQYQTARRIVSASISRLQVGASVKFPGGIGWVQRTEGGYMVQSGNERIVVRTVSEAIEAAASVLAPRVQSGVKK